jgi:hypothetical protein
MRYRKGRKQAGMAMAVMTAVLLLGGAPSQERGGALEQAFAWVRSLWETVDNGWHIDPNGLAVSNPQPTSKDSSDEGMHIDPNGLTISSPKSTSGEGSDNGAHIDPNG